MTVDQFIAMATRLKAAVEQRSIDPSTDNPNPKPEFKRSAPYGGCGLQHCRCSPGLWVSFFDRDRMAVAHFGDDEIFDENDIDQWRALCKTMVEHGMKEV